MVVGSQLRELRQHRGLTQQQAAVALRITQPYLSMLERGRRPISRRLLNLLVRLFNLPATALPLPSSAGAMADAQLADALAALGYPGFQHLDRPRRGLRNPAEVLAAALHRPRLDARTVAALPWLAMTYWDLDWDWLVPRAKLHDRQNQLGYIVMLARKLAARTRRLDAQRGLLKVEALLERSRLATESALVGETLTQAERRWLRQKRPPEARHWNLLTDLTVEHVQYAS